MLHSNIKIRLNKYLASLGIASRRQADELIKQGKIRVNHQVVTQMGTKIDPDKDLVEFEGKKLEPETKTYLIYHKPKGVLSTTKDTHHRPTILDKVKYKVRLYPVGRLDKDSEGLILLTNDGDLAYRLTHPKFHIPKTYEVTILGQIKLDQIEKLQTGIQLEDGLSKPTKTTIIQKSARHSILEMILFEGRKRQIRRMMASLHLHILSLKRVAIGPILLGELKVGQNRALTTLEIKSLQQKQS